MRIVISALSFLLLAAHFLRAGETGLLLLSLSSPLLLAVRRKWAVNGALALLAYATVVWIEAGITVARSRIDSNLPWTRPAIILAAVAAGTLVSALALIPLKKTDRYTAVIQQEWPSTAAFFLTAAIVSTARIKAPVPVLLFDRLIPGSGWVEILLLSSYAAWLTEIMIRARTTALIRARIWAAFSLVFFIQLLLGLAGAGIFFMTGKLHLPVPALIIAGPLYRGGGFFMPILFVSALLLIGPAWCSYLCYFGAWDNSACRVKNAPDRPEPWMKRSRIAILVFITITAIAMRHYNVPPPAAAVSVAAFGLIGVGVMIMISRKRGIMAHCTAWCPAGLAADILGKISPFRITISDACTECGACRSACRYGALEPGDIRKKRPGLTCSLCGDCLPSCGKRAITYRFLALDPETARAFFISIVISLHAAFLGIARM